jgi:hypothetical protein
MRFTHRLSARSDGSFTTPARVQLQPHAADHLRLRAVVELALAGALRRLRLEAAFAQVLEHAFPARPVEIGART